ncbi:hypothetical protein GWI33_000725 [Rhynchophorus ferrugineus]|uniref:Uncharacterized protein n=1 Tax=Rhynchophorus ferrugineus TaxID=354439 RepID=A0A834MIB1_RHYFE|nr:hypothetical protein GWI33_000725 [Rhynchophorus ferrugineus]
MKNNTSGSPKETRLYTKYIAGGEGYSFKNCLDMRKEALSTITPSVWMNSIRHTDKLIDKWWNCEHVLDRLEINSLVIQLGSESEGDSD